MTGVKRKKPVRYPIDHPGLFEMFKDHCEAGWSPRLFMMQIKGTHNAYYTLLKTDPKWRALATLYKQTPAIGFVPKEKKHDS